jgi:hypothetical protein
VGTAHRPGKPKKNLDNSGRKEVNGEWKSGGDIKSGVLVQKRVKAGWQGRRPLMNERVCGYSFV